MGLIQAAKDTINSMLADQWIEYFYCDSLPENTLMVKGKRKNTNSNNNNGNDNIISNGSIIAVNEGQCMIIVDQGGVVDICADAGEFIFDASTEPSVLAGNLGQSVKDSFKTMVKRFTTGGDTAKDQRIYFFNIKEIMNNLFGTANPVPFRVVDTNIGLDMDIAIRCNGSYSFKITDPLLFYKNVAGNVTQNYTRDQLASQMKSELLNALQPAFAKVSGMGVRYSALPGHTLELTNALNEVLSEQWSNKRGIEIVSMNINSVKASEEDEQMIKDMQKDAVYRNKDMLMANMGMGAIEAMKIGAANESTGAMMGLGAVNMAGTAGASMMAPFMQMGGMNGMGMNGMGMNNMGMNNMNGMNGGQMTNEQMAAMQADAMKKAAAAEANGLVAGAAVMGAQKAPVLGWTCTCGKEDNRGKFCEECGAKKPSEAGWTCSCGHVNQGKFCQECGAKKPEGAPIYKCDKCNWEPEDPSNPPKFCPECGDPFDDADKQ